MRRAVPVIAVTVGGLALVGSFHTSPGGAPLAVGPSSTLASTATEPSTSPPLTGSRPTTPGRGSTRSDATTTGSLPKASTSTSTSAATSTRSVDGPLITTNYGPVQVRVTVSGQRLVDVQAVQLPSDRSRSVRISQSAGPKLRTEALQAQSANINLVSGASYTSQGYIESLQGALDKAAP